MFTSAQTLAPLLSTKSASHLLLHLPAPRPLRSSRELFRDAVGKSKTAVFILVKRLNSHRDTCALYICSSVNRQP